MITNCTDYTNILPRGKNRAVPAPELARIMGFTNTRNLQKDIANSRAAGQIICSSSKGYYIPETREEIQAFIKNMESRAKSIFLVLRSARAALREVEGQMKIPIDDLIEEAPERTGRR